MVIKERWEGEVLVLALDGKLSEADEADFLRSTIDHHLNLGVRSFLINMAKVPILYNVGLGELVRSFTVVSRHGGQLKLVDVPKRVMDLLHITKLMIVFEIYNGEAEALASFNKR